MLALRRSPDHWQCRMCLSATGVAMAPTVPLIMVPVPTPAPQVRRVAAGAAVQRPHRAAGPRVWRPALCAARGERQAQVGSRLARCLGHVAAYIVDNYIVEL